MISTLCIVCHVAQAALTLLVANSYQRKHDPCQHMLLHLLVCHILQGACSVYSGRAMSLEVRPSDLRQLPSDQRCCAYFQQCCSLIHHSQALCLGHILHVRCFAGNAEPGWEFHQPDCRVSGLKDDHRAGNTVLMHTQSHPARICQSTTVWGTAKAVCCYLMDLAEAARCCYTHELLMAPTGWKSTVRPPVQTKLWQHLHCKLASRASISMCCWCDAEQALPSVSGQAL